MAARKGNTSRGRPDRRPDHYSAPSQAAAVPEHVREFQRGLFPILVSGDVDAFRRYLARWEEIIGDTGDLGQLPLAEQRTLMSRLLRRPQLYRLPAWPADLADEAEVADVTEVGETASGAPSGASARSENDWPRRNLAAGGPLINQGATGAQEGATASVARGLVPRQQDHAVVDVVPVEPTAPPEPAHHETEAVAEAVPAAASYQLDMLTGELVPVPVEATHVTETPAGYEAEARRPARRRARRRPTPADLVQLAFWPEERSSG